MNNKNNRSCRTIGLHIPKNMASWYNVKNKPEKPQLNFKEKNCSSPHLDINFSVSKKFAKTNCPTVNYREKHTEVISHKLNQSIKLHLRGNSLFLGATGKNTWTCKKRTRGQGTKMAKRDRCSLATMT